MTASTTLAHAALKDLGAALAKVKRMLPNTEVIEWEIVKPIESLEGWLAQTADMLQEELGFE
jgi:hypothetical protein